jgi:hypothetical protein
MASIMGDENMEWAMMGCDRFQRERGGGGSTVSEADDISKSDAALGEAERRGVLASRGRR